MDAASGAAAIWWSIGIAALLLVVIPLVVFLAHRMVNHIVEIKRYADDVLEHGVDITANLEPVPALLDTRASVKKVSSGLAAYAGSVDRMLGGSA